MQCRGVNKRGEPCRAKAMSNGYCYRHNPNISDVAKMLASSKGGRQVDKLRLNETYRQLDLSTLRGKANALEQAINDLRAGNITPRLANSLAQLVTAHNETVTLAELEGRVAILERCLAGGGGN